MLLINIAFVLTTLAILPAEGHVSLTFPQARTYALDFLDNRRTRGPCGYPSYAGQIKF